MSDHTRTDRDEAIAADDPRWTAYLLGELEGDDLAAIEAELAASADARARVEALREVTELLASELAAEPMPALSDAQRAAIEAAAGEDAQRAAIEAAADERAPGRDVREPDIFERARARRRRTGWLVGGGLAAAAAVVLAIGLDGNGSRSSASSVAMEGVAVDSVAMKGKLAAKLGAEGTPEETSGIVSPGGYESSLQRSADMRRNAPVEIRSEPASAKVQLDGVRGALAGKQIGRDREVGRYWNEDEDGDQTPALPNREAYAHVVDNSFVAVADDPRSTFSTDVDTAAYANLRRFLRGGQLPPPSAVRIEEMINYFDYDYPAPAGDAPFAIHVEVGRAPWKPAHKLMRIGLAGRDLAGNRRPRSNLVFLIDVSGSMQPGNKLPLLRRGFARLVSALDGEDRIAIVVYAGASGVVLPSTPVSRSRRILGALDRLSAGGSTNGGAGIELAYRIARENFVEGGVNRVILATDGDFNVGTTSQGELVRLIEDKAKSGVYLTVLGFGMGNYQDATLEQLSGRGNGNYFYIDTDSEAHKVLVEDMNATLVAIAKDVKIQIEFNPAQVARYRLIGYENRVMAHRDFNDDTKDAGDVGAGHTVTALYELVPTQLAAREGGGEPTVDPLKYQRLAEPSVAADSNELCTIKLRYKAPDADTSELLAVAVDAPASRLEDASPEFSLAAGAALFGMVLRKSEHRGSGTLALAASLVDRAGVDRDRDPYGYRGELLDLIRTAQRLGAD